MIKIVVVLGLVACTMASRIGYGAIKEEPKGSVREFIKAAPSPGVLFERAYFTEDGEGGSHFRRGARLANGKVRGSYGLSTADGNTRIVYYEADENGARYFIESNEPGTSDANTGGAVYGGLSGNRDIYDEDASLDAIIDRVIGAAAPAKKEPEPAYRTILVRPGYGY